MRIVPLQFIAFVHICIALTSAQMFPLRHNIGSTLSGFVESVKGVISPSQESETLPSLGPETIPSQEPETFQEEIQKLGPKAGYIVLDEITKAYEGAAQFAIDLKDATEQVIQYSRKTAADLQEIIGKQGITIAELGRRLEGEISGIDLGLEGEEDHQLPECDVDARAQLVAQVLDKVRPVYVAVLTGVAVPLGQAEDQYDGFAAIIRRIFLIISKFICKHPILSDIVIFVVSMLLIPEIPIFRGILRLLGFGLQGPIRGSFAAWLQRKFWSEAVARGSWFAILQRAGMKFAGKWLEKVVTSVGLAAIFGYATGPGQE